MKNNIPKRKHSIPPPIRKKNLWDRYSFGEKLKPTYEKVYPTSNIIDPNLVIESEPVVVKDGVDPFGELADYLLNGFKNIINK